jgi:ethanolamine utilization protein EutN
MIVAQVIGTVVATRKHDKLVGHKIQVVQPLDPGSETPRGNPFVAVDAVGAGTGEVVVVTTGSSARLGLDTIDCPVDSTIIGIIDQLEIQPWQP